MHARQAANLQRVRALTRLSSRPRSLRFCAALTCAALCSLPAAPALAEPVQDFNVQLKDIQRDGRYSIVLTGNSYDTTGLRPPIVTDNALRFARGIRIRREFLTKAYQCDVDAVREALRMPDGKRTYTQRLRDLAGSLRRTRAKLRRALVKKVETCVRSQVGFGNSVADARPTFKEPTPANFFVYLSKPAAKKAEFTLTALVVLDEKGWLWKQAPLLRTFRLAMNLNAFWPGTSGPFGYRLEMPGGGTAGIRASVAELKLTLTGLTRRENGKRLFWLTRPACPRSRNVRFQSAFTYEGGLKQTKSIEIPCPRFIG
jgi:hypothetical protein